jgi:predicted nucleic-acid-binding Zn-ribbon protein
MRATQTCPKCAGKKFAVTSEFQVPNITYAGGRNTLPAIAVEGGGFGRFTTWICIRCGYTEFYAYGCEDIEAIAKQHPDRLRIVDAGSPEQGPYR